MNKTKSSLIRFYIKNLKIKTLFLIYINEAPKINDKACRKLPFIGNTTTTIARHLKDHNIHAAYYSKDTVKSLLVNNKIKRSDKMQNSGVYKIDCNDCNHSYIGKTTRSFDIRFKEHLRHWKFNKPESSNVAKHLIENQHRCSIENFNIIHTENKGLKLDRLQV